MSYQNEWLLFEAEDEFDEIKHREPTEELLFYRAVASGEKIVERKRPDRYEPYAKTDGNLQSNRRRIQNGKKSREYRRRTVLP